ncbi:uroporphyrinogen-III C-methyltransferase [Rhodocyclus tenuis]|uniref:Uroporphyrin-3 C-methyltransferase n=1 Tax=Rhodocyclus tenuis TaxID=1066 RepID=A0A840G1E7_RHOTE|nr:uroporphyrinogen-III C-methyltransferase [Rhodocyclus tenuis]MBB4245776.1 uroporphyrin-3 C-methyltransferase [Rhodocyclus tenuis]
MSQDDTSSPKAALTAAPAAESEVNTAADSAAAAAAGQAASAGAAAGARSSPLPSSPAAPAAGPSAFALPPPRRAAAASAWRNPWLIVALIALALAGWQWVETRLKISGTQQELARRLAENDAGAAETRALARQAEERTAALQERFGALEAKIAESQSQQATLEKLFQDLARSRDEWALAEVEQNVTLAAQQLQLSGNVRGAVAALQTADSRLAAGGRPQLLALRKAINHDLEQLRTLPLADLPGMNLRLESVLIAVDSLPLAIDARPRAETQTPVPTEEGAADGNAALAIVHRFASELWREFRSLVRIQRFDRDEAVLLAPGQSFFLRENLRLHLLNARLALLSRDQTSFRNELKRTQDWLERYFDGRDPAVQAAQGQMKQLAGAEIDIQLPTLNESLSAIRNLQLARERK